MAQNDSAEIAKVAETVETVAGNKPPESVTLSTGQEVQIYKCKTKQIGLVLRMISTVMRELGFTTLNEVVTLKLDNPAHMTSILAHTSDEVFEVAAELCSLSQKDFLELELDDSLSIIMAAFKLNKDFFLQRVLPIVQKELLVTE